MANTREIQSRMKSIQDTMKITNAMYMISSTKLRKAKKNLEETEPYFYTLQTMVSRIVQMCIRDRIYGMGHAVYSLSDPRAQVFKSFVEKLAVAKGRDKDFALYSMIERIAPEVISQKSRIYKGVSANVDFYSGFVYSMLEIPLELYTPIFAIARIVGWSAHRIEELINMDKIIRPAYKSVMQELEYVPLDQR